MDRKFGRFFRYANIRWYKPLLEKWKQEGLWSLATSILSYIIIGYWIGVGEMRLEIRAAISLAGGAIITQIIRYLWCLLNAPFDILKEQDNIILGLKKTDDREKIIEQLSHLFVEGTELRNKGQSVVHESIAESWWNSHLEWREKTKSKIALLDQSKATQWNTLGLYTPKRRIPQAINPLHEKRVQMFDEWLTRLDMLIKDFQNNEN